MRPGGEVICPRVTDPSIRGRDKLKPTSSDSQARALPITACSSQPEAEAWQVP